MRRTDIDVQLFAKALIAAQLITDADAIDDSATDIGKEDPDEEAPHHLA